MNVAEVVLERGGSQATREARGPAAAGMEALVCHGPGKKAWERVPKAKIRDATDAIVRATTSTICGTDLHILKGDLAAVTDTHRFALADVTKAYDTFGKAAKERALKVTLERA